MTDPGLSRVPGEPVDEVPGSAHRLLREPLLHFFVLGALLFSLHGWLHRGLPGSPSEILVSQGQLQSLQAQFERVWHRPATPQELDGLVNAWVREEVLYREGLALGLDRDDMLVRRRIGQKVEFIAAGAPAAPPTDAELQGWLDAHADKYPIEPRYWLKQLYFDPSRHGDGLEADLAAARQALAAGKPVSGDSTMLPEALEGAAAAELVRVFGTEFAEALKTVPVGAWQGPVRSGFGLHLVQISATQSARRATLAEVREAVNRDLAQARTEQANQAFYDRLRAKYTVRVDAPEASASGAAP